MTRPSRRELERALEAIEGRTPGTEDPVRELTDDEKKMWDQMVSDSREQLSDAELERFDTSIEELNEALDDDDRDATDSEAFHEFMELLCKPPDQ
jgi:prephenate dehydrogenase